MSCNKCLDQKKKCFDCLFDDLNNSVSMYDQLVDAQTENEKLVVKLRCLVSENQALKSIIAKQHDKMMRYKRDAYFK